MFVLSVLKRSMTRHQFKTLLHPLLQTGNSYLADSNWRYFLGTPNFPLSADFSRMDSLFINALVTASSCRHHIHTIPTQATMPKVLFAHRKARRGTTRCNLTQDRSIHNTQFISSPPTLPEARVSRDEYKQMLDYYIEPHSDHIGLGVPESSFKSFKIPFTGDNDVSHDRATSSKTQQLAIEKLEKLLDWQGSSNEEIMHAYSVLPSPGVLYLRDEKRRLLLLRIATVERKNRENMLKYLSIVEDMKIARLPMIESEWNSAISFVGRCFTHVKSSDVEAALQIWKEMEQEAQVQSGMVTFNILFDIATKAGKFVLAEMILKEMEARNLPLNRFSRVSIIYYYGLKGEGEGIRKSYRALVDAGEIVDTVVMNCVIASLIRAGEPSAAHHVFERMKRMYSLKADIPSLSQPRQYGRELGRILESGSRTFRSKPGKLRRLQDEQCLCPNLQTFSIFVEHHVAETGELRRITELLEEMQSLQVPMHGRIFVKIFKGFAVHGGVRYTSWTKARLESVWNSLLNALDEGVEDVVVGKWMVFWVVKAFEKCFGREKTLQIWEELRTRWKVSEGEEGAVSNLLRDIVTKQDDVSGDAR